MTRRGRTSRKAIQEALVYLQAHPCLLQDLIRCERLKRWTTDLLTKVHPGSRTTAYRHLERLVELGCLGKHGAGGKGGGGSAPAVYYLSALGARVLTHALERKQPVTYVRPTSRVQEAHDLAMTELAVGWGLLDPAWRVQAPVYYVRNHDALDYAREYREYREALVRWQEWQGKYAPWEASQAEVTELREKHRSLNRQIEELELRWKQCWEHAGHSRTSVRLRDEIVELQEQKQKLEWFYLRDAESRLKGLEPPSHPCPPEPHLPRDLELVCKRRAEPGQSLEEWAAALQPESAHFIPDFHACFLHPDRSDWLVCVEIEKRTERRHIEGKYRQYAEARDALSDHLLSLYVVFTSEQAAQRALPQHRRILNALLREPGPSLFSVSFTDLDHLREMEGESTPARLVWEGMEWEWEAETMDGKLRGVLHEAYEEEWEKWERQRKERERKAYWASRA